MEPALVRGPVEQIRPLFEAMQQHVDDQLAAVQKAQEAGSAKAQRSMQEMQRGVDARCAQVEQQLVMLRQELPQLGQRVTGGRYLVAVLGGVVGGMLVLTALWLALGQAMQVHVIPQPAGQPQSHGQAKGK